MVASRIVGLTFLFPLVVVPASRTADAQDAAAQPPAQFSRVVEELDDGVVYITTQNALRRVTGTGSGFLIDKAGLVATNFHVIQNAVHAYVKFRNGERFEVTGVWAADRSHDLAILQLSGVPKSVDVFPLKQPGELKQGNAVIAIGHPSGFKFTVTGGIVSAVRKTTELPEQFRQAIGSADDTIWVQTSAAISHGSSGGPLLDTKGRLIGLNTWIAKGQNLGFAVHVKHLIELNKRREKSPVPLPIPGLNLITDAKVAALAEEFLGEYERVVLAIRQVPDRQQAILMGNERDPTPDYAGKFVKLAERHPKSTTGLEALIEACRMAYSNHVKSQPHFERAIELLQRDYIDHPRMYETAVLLNGVTDRPQATILLKRLQRESPHKTVRAVANYALANSLVSSSAMYAPEITQSLKALTGKYRDVRLGGWSVADETEASLKVYNSFAIGSPAIAIKGKDVDGKAMKIDDYRGKVTVLSFWSDSSPLARSHYVSNRKLVKDFKERGLRFIGINRDEAAVLRRLRDAEIVTWPNFHDGVNGPISKEFVDPQDSYNIVVDHEGRIRFSNFQGTRLRTGVEVLLSEMEFTFPRNIIRDGDTWSYQVAGKQYPKGWNQQAFDDTRWKTGNTPIGFGRGDESTTLADRDVRTVLFRKKFDVKDYKSVSTVMLEVDIDDAIAVWVNGTEVLRTNMAHDAGTQTYATEANGGHGFYQYAIDKKVLKPKDNVIAVEVHQHELANADFRFDLAIGSNLLQSLPQPISLESSPHRRRIIASLRTLGKSAETFFPQLEAILKTADHELEGRILVALMRTAPQRKLPALRVLKTEQDRQLRHSVAIQYAARGGTISRSPNYSRDDYENAMVFLKVAEHMGYSHTVMPKFLALSDYRLGNYKKAIGALRGNFFIRPRVTPLLLACLTMSHAKLGETQEANDKFKLLEDVINKPEFAKDITGYQLYREAKKEIEAMRAEVKPSD